MPLCVWLVDGHHLAPSTVFEVSALFLHESKHLSNESPAGQWHPAHMKSNKRSLYSNGLLRWGGGGMPPRRKGSHASNLPAAALNFADVFCFILFQVRMVPAYRDTAPW